MAVLPVQLHAALSWIARGYRGSRLSPAIARTAEVRSGDQAVPQHIASVFIVVDDQPCARIMVRGPLPSTWTLLR
jgi:hypothetical protein